jgi:hypothetical protein
MTMSTTPDPSSRWPALVLLVALVASACRGDRAAPAPPQPEIPVRVTILLHAQIRIDHELVDLEDRTALAAVRWIREQAAPRLSVDPERPLEIAVRVDVSEDLSRFVIDERLRLRHDRTWPLEVSRLREVPIGRQGVDLSATLAAGVRDSLGLLADMAGLFDLPDEELLAKAARAEAAVDVRSLAVRILQERRSTGSVDGLLALFDGAPSDLRLTLLDAAGTLLKPEQLSGLLSAVDARRIDEITRALRAAALVGGQDATEFVGWMAVGHLDERVRRTALEAYLQITESMAPEDVVQLGLVDTR